MSLIRLANSWRIFDSPRQFMDLWFASPIHGPRECDVVRRLSINLIVWWAQRILIQRSDITPTDLARRSHRVASSFVLSICVASSFVLSICAASRRNWTINQTKVDVNPIFVLCVSPKFQIAKIGEITSYQIKQWYYLLILFKLDWKYLTYCQHNELVWWSALPNSYTFKGGDLLLGRLYHWHITLIVTTWIGILEKRRFNFI